MTDRPASRIDHDVYIRRRPRTRARARELLQWIAVALVIVAAVTADNASDRRWLIALFAAFVGWVVLYAAVAVSERLR